MSANTIVGFCGAKPKFYIGFWGLRHATSVLHRCLKVLGAELQFYTRFCRFCAWKLRFTQVSKGFWCQNTILHRFLQGFGTFGGSLAAPPPLLESNMSHPAEIKLVTRLLEKNSNPSAAELVSSMARKSVLDGSVAIPLCLHFRPQKKIVTKKIIIWFVG